MNHPNLSPEINAALNSPGANEEGFYFTEDKCTVRTTNSTYELEYAEDGTVWIVGRDNEVRAAPKPPGYEGPFRTRQKVRFVGSTFGGSMIKLKWIGTGMRLEVVSLATGNIITMTPCMSWTRPARENTAKSEAKRFLIAIDETGVYLRENLCTAADLGGPRKTYTAVPAIEADAPQFIRTALSALRHDRSYFAKELAS